MREPGYITGAGQTLVNVHEATADCYRDGCVVHNPTDPRPWPTYWNANEGRMERLCEHDIGHPDKNHVNFARRVHGEIGAAEAAEHECDGCCAAAGFMAT